MTGCPAHKEMLSGNRLSLGSRRRVKAVAGLFAALFSAQCVGDFLSVPPPPIYTLEEISALSDSVNIGDAIPAPTLRMKVDGVITKTAWQYSIVSGDDVMQLDSEDQLAVLKPGVATIRVRPKNSAISD